MLIPSTRRKGAERWRLDRVVEYQLGSQGELLREVTYSVENWKICRSHPGKEQRKGKER